MPESLRLHTCHIKSMLKACVSLQVDKHRLFLSRSLIWKQTSQHRTQYSRENSSVRGESRGKDNRRFFLFKIRQSGFKFCGNLDPTSYKGRTVGRKPITIHRVFHRSNQPGIIPQAEVVARTQVSILAPTDHDLCTVRRTLYCGHERQILTHNLSERPQRLKNVHSSPSFVTVE